MWSGAERGRSSAQRLSGGDGAEQNGSCCRGGANPPFEVERNPASVRTGGEGALLPRRLALLEFLCP